MCGRKRKGNRRVEGEGEITIAYGKREKEHENSRRKDNDSIKGGGERAGE